MSSLAALPLFTGSSTYARSIRNSAESSPINFVLDGYFFEPKQYIKKLQEIEAQSGIQSDFYSAGGVVKELEQKFCEITGKERAMYMPSGTMANELSIRILCGNKTKAIVHDQSHIYRDEGDSAQAIHNKRLVPIDTGKHFFTVNDLSDKIETLKQGEVFYDGVGAISIENPVRRHFGKIVDLEHIKSISAYAHENEIKTHLDGARIHLAAAYSGIPVKEYCSYFDTAYISLYKYLGAAGGAILCGDHNTMDQMSHFMKILGGTVFRSWTNASMALHFLDGLDQRLSLMLNQSNELLKKLNDLDELQMNTVANGSNVVKLTSKHIKLETFANEMNASGIMLKSPQNEEIEMHLNETILARTNEELLSYFKSSIKKSK